MKKYRKLYCLVLGILLSLSLVVSGCGSNSTANTGSAGNAGSNAPEYTIRFAGTLGAENTATQAQYFFKEYVEEQSKGRIKVEVYHSGQLGGQTELNESVKSGSITMTMGSPSYMGANYEPMFNVLALPFIITPQNLEKAYAAVDGEIGIKLDNALQKSGFVTLGWMQIGFRHVTNSKKTIKGPDDLKGILIRLQPNEIHMQTFKALGANPQTLDFAELYSALQQGVIDSQENSLDNIYSNKFNEAQKYLSTTGHFFDFQPIWINKDFFDKLPSDLQQVLRDAGKKAAQKQREDANAAEADRMKQLGEHLEITELTDEQLSLFQEKVTPIWDSYYAGTGDKEFLKEVFKALEIDYNFK